MADKGEAQVQAAEPERHICIETVRFGRPRTLEGWRTTVASEFDVDIRLVVATVDEARRVGLPCLSEVAASLSFLGSAPVEILNVSITDSPPGHLPVGLVDSPEKKLDVKLTDSEGQPEPGREYTTILYPEFFKPQVPPTGLAVADLSFLTKRKPERVVRALRWMQKSYFADNPVDEFTYLMVAFESVSEMLKPAGAQYWRCGHCGAEVRQCPACQESTASKMTGAVSMREFVTQTMGWTGRDWRDVWGWRGKVLHGQADISMDEEHAIREYLPKLEQASIAAVKSVAGLAPGGAPTQVRQRVPFSDPHLEVKWHV
jgi:hypothetical protein